MRSLGINMLVCTALAGCAAAQKPSTSARATRTRTGTGAAAFLSGRGRRGGPGWLGGSEEASALAWRHGSRDARQLAAARLPFGRGPKLAVHCDGPLGATL